MAYELEEKSVRSLEGEFGKRVLGCVCPVRNELGDTCNECARVKALFRMKTGDAEQEAKSRSAKPTYFINAMLRKDNSTVVMKLGREAANDLYDACKRARERYGRVLGLADPEKARWLAIRKSGEHPNFKYKFEITDDEAPAVTKELVDGLDNHENITQRFNDGELELFNVSGIQVGTSVEFRLLPIPVGNGKAKLMTWVYYHWRCRESDILGGESATTMADPVMPKEFAEFTRTVEAQPTKQPEKPKDFTVENPPACFGYYDGMEECLQASCNAVREACASRAGYVKNDAGEFVKNKPKK